MPQRQSQVSEIKHNIRSEVLNSYNLSCGIYDITNPYTLLKKRKAPRKGYKQNLSSPATHKIRLPLLIFKNMNIDFSSL